MKPNVHESDYRANNFHVRRYGNTLKVDLTYPPRDNEPDNGRVRYVGFNQESVRASDGVRLHYDYERDGVVVEQASRFTWNADDKECDPDWQEVAFIPSWGRQESDEDEERRLTRTGHPVE